MFKRFLMCSMKMNHFNKFNNRNALELFATFFILVAFLFSGCAYGPDIGKRLSRRKEVKARKWARVVKTSQDIVINVEPNVPQLAVSSSASLAPHEYMTIRLDIQIPDNMKYVLWIVSEENNRKRRLMRAIKKRHVAGDYYFREEKKNALSIYLRVPTRISTDYLLEMAFVNEKYRVLIEHRRLFTADIVNHTE